MLASDVLIGGRYRLVRRIGAGGMAEVWCAEDHETGRPVAVKLLAEGSGDVRRFAAEVRALSRVAHPAVVRFLGAGDHGGRPYLVMDLVEGETLAERLAAGPLPPDEVARTGATLAGALAAAHRVGVVHRDVKPGNVLLDGERRVHLADFGVSRLAGAASITGVGTVVGTAGYLAPEQVSAGSVGPAADVYALGLVLLECLTGERAFPGAPFEAAAARLSRDPAVPPGLPAPWPSLLAAMTARDPAARPTADAVARALGGPGAAAAAGGPGDVTVAMPRDATSVLPAAVAATGPRPAPAPVRRPAGAPLSRVPLVLVGVVLLLAGLLVVVLAASADDDGPLTVPTTTAPTGAEATTVPPTTAAPTTSPPTTAAPTTTTVPPTTAPGPPPPQDDGRGNGDDGDGDNGDNGNGNGNGNGRGKGDDD